MQKDIRLKIKGAPEYDRFDSILRFTAWHGKTPVSFSVSVWAVRLIAQRKDRPIANPRIAFAVAGKPLDDAMEKVFAEGGCDTSGHYHIDAGDLPREISG